MQIGHGSGSGLFSNNVTSAATINVSFCDPAPVSLSGGGNNSFAMIGNGGGTGNYQRNCRHAMALVGVRRLRIEITATNGLARAQIYGVRVIESKP